MFDSLEITLAMRSQAMGRDVGLLIDRWRDAPLQPQYRVGDITIDLESGIPPEGLATPWCYVPGETSIRQGVGYAAARRLTHAPLVIFCAGPIEVVPTIRLTKEPSWPPEAAPDSPIYKRGWTIGGHYPLPAEPDTAELLEQLQWDSLEAADEPPPYAYIAGTGLLPEVSRKEAIAAARGTPAFIYVGESGVSEIIYTDGGHT